MYSLMSLKSICIRPFVFLKGTVIENISLRCGGFLKYLCLRGCQSVGSQSIRTLAQHCHNIEHLDLAECKKITDVAIQPLSKNCSKLTAINLESCSEISDCSLKALSDGCPVRFKYNRRWTLIIIKVMVLVCRISQKLTFPGVI